MTRVGQPLCRSKRSLSSSFLAKDSMLAKRVAPKRASNDCHASSPSKDEKRSPEDSMMYVGQPRVRHFISERSGQNLPGVVRYGFSRGDCSNTGTGRPEQLFA